ncbi:MAG: hypothetical protein CMM96_05910 [Rickettsiales bacterium]|nr:hypothetical protein [Rickettsiales bacterium]
MLWSALLNIFVRWNKLMILLASTKIIKLNIAVYLQHLNLIIVKLTKNPTITRKVLEKFTLEDA